VVFCEIVPETLAECAAGANNATVRNERSKRMVASLHAYAQKNRARTVREKPDTPAQYTLFRPEWDRFITNFSPKLIPSAKGDRRNALHRRGKKTYLCAPNVLACNYKNMLLQKAVNSVVTRIVPSSGGIAPSLHRRQCFKHLRAQGLCHGFHALFSVFRGGIATRIHAQNAHRLLRGVGVERAHVHQVGPQVEHE